MNEKILLEDTKDHPAWFTEIKSFETSSKLNLKMLPNQIL
jgi:hypothetical protein